MDYFAAMRAFVRAVELGRFSKAAVENEVKVSTVSRYVSALEADIGAPLLTRSTRSLRLTEVGSLFYERSAVVLSDLDDARRSARSLGCNGQVQLKIAMPGAFGCRHIVPRLKAFYELHPEICLDLSLSEVAVDLTEGGFDLIVRIGSFEETTLTAHKLAASRQILVASPAYLRTALPLQNPDDLAQHESLSLAALGKNLWHYRSLKGGGAQPIEVKPRGWFRTNDFEAMLIAVRDGLGIGLLPTWLLQNDMKCDRVAQVLADWAWFAETEEEQAIWSFYPPNRTVSPKVRAFVDFLASRFGRPPYWGFGLSSTSEAAPLDSPVPVLADHVSQKSFPFRGLTQSDVLGA